ncbi:MAG: hypothetical protein Q8R70_06825 [Methanoregula sp.]|nr:hypothetical protein [Methanoregula sp.]
MKRSFGARPTVYPLAFDEVGSEYFSWGKVVGKAFDAGKKASFLKY